MKKQLLLLVMILLPMVASADDSGKCGSNTNYTYTESNHTLRIYGSGNMYNYKYDSQKMTTAPWGSYRSDIFYVVVEDGVTSIGEYAFYMCSSLTSISIGNDVNTIGVRSFESCGSLETLMIPSNVTSIKDYAFSLCSGLASINFSNGLLSIGDCAFDWTKNLSGISIPQSVTTIGKEAFKHSGLTTLSIPNNVKTMGEYAFESCQKLKNVSIEGVTSIKRGTFYDCTQLESVTISNSVKSIENGAFNYCIRMTSINIPNSVTTIEDNTFKNCYSLKSIKLPDNLKEIKSSLFSGCSSLKSIVIPSKVEFIYHKAFEDCGLSEVKSYASTPPSAFDDSFGNYNIPLYIPENSVDLYLSTNPWGKFSTIKTLSGSDIEKKQCSIPTISYVKGKLSFDSETEDVEYNYTITISDNKTGKGKIAELTATYNISVYATKTGYDNSDVVTATLCWIDQTPKTEGITNGMANIPANAVLIQSAGGTIKVQGCDEGEQVSVYGINGTQAGSAISQSGAATINTNLQPGSIAIVKIGQKSVKVVIK